ncbi:hypothetical protein KOW79_016557 [Hemibagrus wyckioides]|uniref:Vitelline envelope sperm lysin receptor n=1 Tax=Hemibagrus wyckioides TaxID=337641 RepID=A0A9D3SHN5_9TELE|nr:hypothetical protein KOW79_016557 [Hemibagrus wyckioides]
MLWCSSAALRLAVALSLSVRSFAEQKLLCSSDSMSLWWEYQGPLYHLSISTGPCTNGMDIIKANYTLITKFAVSRAGYTVTVFYRNQLWVEFFQPPLPCTDLKICNIVKGETLSETLSLPINPYNAAEGEYYVCGHLNIIDDLEREINISINATVHVRNNDIKATSSPRPEQKRVVGHTLTAGQFGLGVLIKRRKVYMMLWCSSAALRLAVALSLSVRSFAEQKLLCSSDSLSVWWEYQVFTMVQLGFHLRGLYKNTTWFSLNQPLGPCEDFRACGVIKGETIHETIQFSVKPYFTPDGEYQFIITANIIDDFEREFTVTSSSRPLPVSESERRVLKAVHTSAENYVAYAARPEELAVKAKQSDRQNYTSEELDLQSCSKNNK